ncbi:MAG: histidine phosphatase family protein [Kangiellaceae bacterium]|nr:histidine phosphatase family protein [Kangiellaceae bacterium]
MPTKKLFIFRHGKSDWTAKFKTDHERPLAERGIQAAQLMGEHLTKIEQQPELVVSSTAKRALDTAHLAHEFGQWDCEIKSSRNLYLASVEEALEQIHAVSSDIERLMIVAHEPMCSELISELCFGAHVKFPTAAVACLKFRVDEWRQVKANKGQLTWLLTPKVLSKK